MKFQRRLIIASNRLPLTAATVGAHLHFIPSDGGLVRAMTSILHDSGGCWIGWPGSVSNERVTSALDSWTAAENYSLQPVLLNEAEQNAYYKGF